MPRVAGCLVVRPPTMLTPSAFAVFDCANVARASPGLHGRYVSGPSASARTITGHDIPTTGSHSRWTDERALAKGLRSSVRADIWEADLRN
jgi:hypothetical protein